MFTCLSQMLYLYVAGVSHSQEGDVTFQVEPGYNACCTLGANRKMICRVVVVVMLTMPCEEQAQSVSNEAQRFARNQNIRNDSIFI